MNILDEQEARAEAAVEARKRGKALDAQLAKDVRELFATPVARRVLGEFLTAALMSHTPFRLDPLAMAHAVAWQDAGNWWLDQLRTHCPEREQQMRNEQREAARVASQGQDRNDD